MKRVVVLTPPDVRCGFALTGVEQRTLVPDQLLAELRTLLEDREVGLVIVEDRLAGAVPQQALRELERRSRGLLVLLPAPQAGAEFEEDPVLRLIRRAIGYQVRLGP